MSHRRIANITAIRENRNQSAAMPYVVERLSNIVEHITGGPRCLHTSTSYTVTKVGYYATQAQAFKAADKSARRYGGFVRSIMGVLSPSFPYDKAGVR